ncbi:MAG TPA: SGNH/GDSL hydrolase family protein, partial [Thermoanaerobaculia bacterium]|nr:SGNH/GDSL hydrolase family protein [Thermoanaerobaculia bacterium]
MIRLQIALCLMLLILTGCGSDGVAPPSPETRSDGRQRYLALGDSYTIGEAVVPRLRFPVQLANLLATRGKPVDDPVIIARTGWTTSELIAAVEADPPEGEFALVTLLIGVNDQYRGRDAEEYREDFREMLQKAISFASGSPARVVVVSIPDWGLMPYAEGRDRGAIAAEIDRFNQVAREEAERAGARWVDITTFSRSVSHHEPMIASDGLHPS